MQKTKTRASKRKVTYLRSTAAPDYQVPRPVFQTELGRLFKGDCLQIMQAVESDTVDLVFADPPFNLNKKYPSNIDDNIKADEYLRWTQEWLSECVRVLRPGGSLFVWNLPRWNIQTAAFLDRKLTFRHWITVDIKYTLPIAGRLYPSHYSLLYYCKGPKPKVFHPDRLPMPVCGSCFADLRDYGGYKDRMNPRGVNMPDVWTDIPPVRHAKYKKRKGANELPLRLLDRIIEMASDESDLVLDPFGGSGTTYVTAELKRRRWLGIEIGPETDIVKRFESINDEREYLQRIRSSYNNLFAPEVAEQRRRRNLWTVESVRTREPAAQDELPFDTPSEAKST